MFPGLAAHFGHFAGGFYSLFDVSYKQSRHWRSDGYRVLAHKLLLLSQVIGLFIVKLLIFDTRNVVVCVDIRIVVFWSGFKSLFSKIKGVLLFQVSTGAHSIDLSKINIYRGPIFGSI